jgi:hypothetical protein
MGHSLARQCPFAAQRLGRWFLSYFDQHNGRMKMKRLLLTFAILAVATAFTAPVFAGLKDAKNKAECEKAGGVWIEKDNKCGAKVQ